MPVVVELVGGKIWADIPYRNGDGPELAKSIPGARPKYEGKKFLAWTYPLNLAVCRRFREVFGRDLEIGDDLAAWARKEVAREKEQIELRSADTAELTRVAQVAPALAAALESRPFQKAGVRFAVNGRTTLIADEPGLGKTLQTLGALVEDGAKTALVFCKKKAIETVWGAEVPRWLGDAAEVYLMIGTAKQREAVIEEFQRGLVLSDDKLRILVGNIEMVRMTKVPAACLECGTGDKYTCPRARYHRNTETSKYPALFDIEWDAIVVDESHKALIGKNVMSKNITQTRLGVMRLALAENGLKIALSGTPFRGKPMHAWGTLNWLAPKLFTSFWKWAELYFEVSKGYANSNVIGELRPERIKDYDRMLQPYLIRRTKGEVASELPAKQYCGTPLDPTNAGSTIGVWLDLEPAQARSYKSVLDDGIAKLADGEKLFIDGLLSELTRRKQFAVCSWARDPDGNLIPKDPASSNKYQWLREFIEERADAGMKIVVASQFTRVVNALSAWLRADGIESYVLTGETSDRVATASVRAFNDSADPVPVFFINTMAGGESINLDNCADDIVFLDETFIPDDQLQAEDRVHRLSRNHQVRVWYVRSRGTIEEKICRITSTREALTKARLDGSRGISITRQLLEE